MTRRTSRSSTSRDLRDAAERLLTSIMAEPAVVEAVVDAEIARRVDAGELIPAERLMVGPGLALVPMQRLTELEAAMNAALDSLEQGQVLEAAEALIGALDAEEPTQAQPSPLVADEEPGEDTPESDEPEPEPTTEPEPEPEDPAESRRRRISVAIAEEPATGARARNQNGGGDGKPLPKDDEGRPVDMPAADDTVTCEECGVDVPGDQAQMSFIRFRKRLCRDDFVNYKKPAAL